MNRVGVLSLQGDYAMHRASLEALGVEVARVVLPEDLDGCDALVMPGGESTTMMRLMDARSLRPALERFVREMPVMGTCAGVILLGKDGAHLPGPPFGVLDVSVERNAYGRQIDSFTDRIDVPMWPEPVQGVFIRAPRIRRVGAGVEVIARRAGEAVGVRQGKTVGLCFHPELTSDRRFHRWFLTEVAGLSVPGESPAHAPRAEHA